MSYGTPSAPGQASLMLENPQSMFPSPVNVATDLDGGPLAPVKGRQVSVADFYQCFLHDDGTVGCWGVQDAGLGGACSGSSCLIDPVPGLAGVVEIRVADGPCACARLQTGEVDCWGVWDNGCLGPPGAMTGGLTPTKVLDGPAVQLAVGDGQSRPVCARLLNGRVSCWGKSIPPTDMGISDVLDVTVGVDIVVLRTGPAAATAQGTVGAGLFWSTLVPPAADAGTPDGGPEATTWALPLPYPGFGTVEHMGEGYAICAAQADGTVQCASTYGGPGNSPPTPVPVPGVPAGTIAEIAAGFGDQYDYGIQCLRLAGTSLAGNVFCWGDDDYGALGVGGPEYQTTKIDVPSFSTLPVTSLTTGLYSTSAVLQGGSAWFWGTAYAYGTGWPGTPTPSQVDDLGNNNVTLHTDDDPGIGEGYATKTGSTAVALVQNAMAENGSHRLQTFTTTSFADARRGSAVDFGRLPTAAPTNGQVVAFSGNEYQSNGNECGLFGDGTTTLKTAAQAVPGVSATALAYQDFGSCDSHVCVILTSGALQCWGSNSSGESGVLAPDGGTPSNIYQPTTVVIPGVTMPIVSVAVGHNATCATDGPSGTGLVYCWGANDFGQLGLGFTPGYTTPVPMAVSNIGPGSTGGDPSPAVSVSSFEKSTCAWLADKTVWCWGDNGSGQLGNGTFTSQNVPVQVTGITNAASVSVGPDFACSVDTAGTVVSCWGSSYDGQCGSGKNGLYATPTPVSLP